MALTNWIEQIGYYDALPEDRRRALIYGPTGAGKTTFAGTWPKPFFIDTDKGGMTLRKLHVPFLPIAYGDKASEIVREVLDALASRKPPFEKDADRPLTIVFDSFTSLAEMVLQETLLWPTRPGQVKRNPLNTKPEWDDYNAVKARLHDIVLRCKDLGLNIVAICGEKLEKDEVLGTFVGKPNLVGGYRDLIGYDFDELLYLDTEGTGDRVRYNAYAQKYRYYDAKSRYGLKGKFEAPSFEKLYGKEGGKE